MFGLIVHKVFRWLGGFFSAMLVAVSLSPLAANAQSSACAANETLQTYSFVAPNNWDSASPTLQTGGAPVTIGTGASQIQINGTADTTFSFAPASTGPTPTTASRGGLLGLFLANDWTTNTQSQDVTMTFSKPVSKMRFVVTDVDGEVPSTRNYSDQVIVIGQNSAGAVVTPSVVAQNAAFVSVAGNVATAANGSAQCATTDASCNATYSFVAPITSFTLTFQSGPGVIADPGNQGIGLANLAFCIQNPDLSLVKNDGGSSMVSGLTNTAAPYTFTVSNVGSAATSGTTTVKDVLPAGMSFTAPLTAGGANGVTTTCVVSTTTNANDTATCTTTSVIAAGGTYLFTLPVTVALSQVGGTTLTNRAKVYGGGDHNKAAETTTGLISDCTLASEGLAGAVVNAGCGFETTTISAQASLVITKTDGKTVSAGGGTNNYVVTLSNQGPSNANGAVITDVVGAGLTCPAANVVTCSGATGGAVCPAAPLTVANLTGAGITVATLPPTGFLQFAYTCNVN